jgi:DNA (cytosine-5)-methyltransferase 1
MNAISLFSGCGGDSLGLENAGFRVIAFNEFKKSAIESHEANFPSSKLIRDPKTKKTDITCIPDAVFETYRNKVELIFAGFPCQGFSHAGKKKVTDPRNQLYKEFLRATRLIQPTFIIGENVVGLTSMKSGPAADSPSMLQVITEEFDKIGYTLTTQIVEATEFGVPQKRKRILLVGWNHTEIEYFNTELFWKTVTKFGLQKKQSMPKLRSFITTSLEDAYEIPSNAVPDDFQTYAIPIPDSQQPSGNPHPYIVLKANENLLSCKKRDSPMHSEIIDVDAPSKTIICTYDHQPRLLVGLRKSNGTSYIRCLLPDELKQIQGFPASYQILGSKKDKVVQIGNAVPPPIIECVANALASMEF